MVGVMQPVFTVDRIFNAPKLGKKSAYQQHINMLRAQQNNFLLLDA